MDNVQKNLQEKIEEIIKENKLNNSKVTIEDTTNKGGYLSIPNEITIKGTVDGKEKKLNLFLKSAPRGNAVRGYYPIRSMYINEINMYTKIIPTLQRFQEEKKVNRPFKSIAKCYKSSTIENEEFLIFEDLLKKDFVIWDKSKPMTIRTVEYILKEIAIYHSISFAIRDQKLELFQYILGKIHCQAKYFFQQPKERLPLYVETAQIALKCFDPIEDKFVYDKFKNFIENELEAVFDAVSPPNESVIIHGDSWCNNFMLKFVDPEKPDEVVKMKFLDWQCSRFNSPVIDLSHFFYCNGPQEAFDNLDYYLKFYYKQFSSSLKEMGTNPEKVFSFDTFKNHWKKYSRFGFVLACSLMDIYYNKNHGEAVNLSEFLENGGDLSSIFGRGDALLDNKMYKRRIRGIVEHFVRNNFI